MRFFGRVGTTVLGHIVSAKLHAERLHPGASFGEGCAMATRRISKDHGEAVLLSTILTQHLSVVNNHCAIIKVHERQHEMQQCIVTSMFGKP